MLLMKLNVIDMNEVDFIDVIQMCKNKTSNLYLKKQILFDDTSTFSVSMTFIFRINKQRFDQ